MNQYQINAVFGMPSDTAMKYLDYVLGGLEYDINDNSIVNSARTFRIANLSRLDIAQDILNGLKSSLKNRTGVKGFQKEVSATLKKKGWWDTDELIDENTGEVKEIKNGKLAGNSSRLKLIYKNMTNTMKCVGRYVAMTEAAFAYPYWQYKAVMDHHTRDEHAKLHNKIFRYDDPIWDVIFPPNDFNCRCDVIALTEDDIIEKNLTVLKSTGQSAYEVADYIDENGNPVMKKVKGVTFMDENGKEVVFYSGKGFDHNAARGFFKVDLNNYNTELARQYIEAELNSPVLDMMYKNGVKQVSTQDELNVAALSHAQQKALKINTKTLVMEQKILNALLKNSDLKLSDFRLMQKYILNAQIILSDAHGLYFCTHVSDGYAVVAVTFSGKVASLTFLSQSQFELIKQLKVIIKDE